MQTNNSILTEDFLIDLYSNCLSNEYILAIVVDAVKPDYLPDRDFVLIHKALAKHYKEYKKAPSQSILRQSLSSKRSTTSLLDDIIESGNEIPTEQLLESLERYIKQVKFQRTFAECAKQYNSEGFEGADRCLQEYADWSRQFSLTECEYTNVIESFSLRFKENRQRHNTQDRNAPITRFYIDALDAMNDGRDLRTQLTCFLAATGVGKSHVARWIGKNACQIDGLNVLHIQLEGSKAEVLNAYSASLVQCSSFKYETGTLRDSEIAKMEEELAEVGGTLYVKSYPKFDRRVSTVDIRNAIIKFRQLYGINPDVVIIDSMDLLQDASGRRYSDNGERHKRIAVANDLKDLAADENVWMVVTYQSTIENREWLNDEKNVLSEYNTAEAKGLSRPMTHLITLNQSDNERRENTMRINVAKSRFFKKGDPFRIATDYEHECFYDRARTLTINKIK